MFHDLCIIVVVVFGVFQVKALRPGQPSLSERTVGKRTTVQSEAVGASECEGRKPQWVQEGAIKRLRGPVFNIHVAGPYHTAGRFLVDLAVKAGKMNYTMYQRWGDLGKAELWKDQHWTDLEDWFPKGHTLRDLGCGTGRATILGTVARHPLNMFLHRWYACKDWEQIVKSSERGVPDAAKKKRDECHPLAAVCQPGEEPCEWDNILLQAFTGVPAASLTRADLELAKSRLRNFDIIFIVEHFSHTLQLTTTRLGWRPDPSSGSLNATLHKADESEDQERFPRGEITREQWQAVMERNSLDIEFYDYMRELAFGMLRADGLPVPPEDERIVVPQWRKLALYRLAT